MRDWQSPCQPSLEGLGQNPGDPEAQDPLAGFLLQGFSSLLEFCHRRAMRSSRNDCRPPPV